MFEGLASILRRNAPTIVGASQALAFDCSISEDHGIDIALTEKPIEAVPGQTSVVSDHAVIGPRVITMVVKVSNLPDQLLAIQPTRHLRVWRQLRDMAKRIEIVDVVTTLEIYTSMVFTRVGYPRTKQTTNCAEITCVLREAQFTVVDVAQELADAVSEIASGAADMGAQGTQAQSIADLTTMGVL